MSQLQRRLRNGFIDFGWDKFTPEQKLKKRTIELNQGRAAMMGILGLMVHEQLGVPLLPSAQCIGLPVKFTDTPGGVRGPAPTLGQHTDEVLAEYGFSLK